MNANIFPNSNLIDLTQMPNYSLLYKPEKLIEIRDLPERMCDNCCICIPQGQKYYKVIGCCDFDSHPDAHDLCLYCYIKEPILICNKNHVNFKKNLYKVRKQILFENRLFLDNESKYEYFNKMMFDYKINSHLISLAIHPLYLPFGCYLI